MDNPTDVVDVPIEDDNEHSQLPSVEEARMHAHHVSATHHSRGGASRKKRIMYASILLGIALVGLVIGLAVGFSGKKKQTSESGTPEQSNVEQKPMGQPSPSPTTEQPVLVPTPPPFTGRQESIISFLLENEISDFDAVRTAGTPQYRAIEFIANQDALFMDVPDPDTSMDDAFEFLQRYAVSVFYYALGVTNLVSSASTCEWYRSFHNVGGHNTNIGVLCDGDGRVRHIITQYLNLQGSLPEELGILTRLETLVIPGNNNVYGTIPHALHMLTELEMLDLASNNLSGEIPQWIGELTKLNYLSLRDNKLEGTLPLSMANLTDLSLLAVDGNTLTGSIHVIDNLRDMKYLYLESNQFEQTIRNTTFRNLNRLVHIDLSANKFHGDHGIPRHFFEIPNLEVLDLTNNRIKGTLPEDIPEQKDLRFLFLHGNELNGTIPSSIRNLPYVHHLDLSGNKFTGTIQEDLGRLSSLVYLFLANNDFDAGEVPEFLERLTSLRDLSLKGTQRTGTIPTWIGSLRNLILLDLDRNSLEGSIPSHLGNLEKLNFLLLNRNELSGTVPEEIGSIVELRKLSTSCMNPLLLFVMLTECFDVPLITFVRRRNALD